MIAAISRVWIVSAPFTEKWAILLGNMLFELDIKGFDIPPDLLWPKIFPEEVLLPKTFELEAVVYDRPKGWLPCEKLDFPKGVRPPVFCFAGLITDLDLAKSFCLVFLVTK